MQPVARSDWIVAICSVVFDLDVGQQIESVCPIGALSEPTASAVAFHSFPVSLYTRPHKTACAVQSVFVTRFDCHNIFRIFVPV